MSVMSLTATISTSDSPQRRGPEDVAADAAEPVDAHSYAHPASSSSAKTDGQSTRPVRARVRIARVRRASLIAAVACSSRPRAGCGAADDPAPPPAGRRRAAAAVRAGGRRRHAHRPPRRRRRARAAAGRGRARERHARPPGGVLRPAGRRRGAARCCRRGRARRAGDRPDPGRARPLRPPAGRGHRARRGPPRVNEELVAGGYAEVFRGDGRAALLPALRAARARRRAARAAACGVPAAGAAEGRYAVVVGVATTPPVGAGPYWFGSGAAGQAAALPRCTQIAPDDRHERRSGTTTPTCRGRASACPERRRGSTMERQARRRRRRRDR